MNVGNYKSRFGTILAAAWIDQTGKEGTGNSSYQLGVGLKR